MSVKKTAKPSKTSKTQGIQAHHHRAALLLAVGKDIAHVSKALKVSEEQVRRWQTLCLFEALVNQYRSDLLALTENGVLGLGPLAFETLENTMKYGETWAERCNAAKFVLTEIAKKGSNGIGPTDAKKIAAQKLPGYSLLGGDFISESQITGILADEMALLG